MSHCSMSHCSMSHCSMSHCSMSHCNMSHCSMSHCSMSHCSMSHCSMSHCSMSHCNMSHCSMSHCSMSHCSMSHCNMSHCSMSRCRVKTLLQLSEDGTLGYRDDDDDDDDNADAAKVNCHRLILAPPRPPCWHPALSPYVAPHPSIEEGTADAKMGDYYCSLTGPRTSSGLLADVMTPLGGGSSSSSSSSSSSLLSAMAQCHRLILAPPRPPAAPSTPPVCSPPHPSIEGGTGGCQDGGLLLQPDRASDQLRFISGCRGRAGGAYGVMTGQA
ncbi:hypothetical protein CRUP_026579 [Coryphaenoides rupestris]|nr:hypothetical protein CRUP_026579 [Coryphaenoides rupestris]